MAMHTPRTRSVVVRGISYAVVTGVSWSACKEHWIVSLMDNGTKIRVLFEPRDHGDSVPAALEAALAKAEALRRSFQAEWSDRTINHLDHNPPLPSGLRVVAWRRRKQARHYELMVDAFGALPAQSFYVGVSKRYSQDDYNRALQKALEYRQTQLLSAPAVVEPRSRSELQEAFEKLEASKKNRPQFPQITFNTTA